MRRSDQSGIAIAQIIADTYDEVAPKNWFKNMFSNVPVRVGSVTLSAPGTAASLVLEPATRPAVDPYRDLYKLLVRLGRAAQKKGTGIALLIDEMQQFKKRDLEVVLQVSRRLEGLPVTLIAAGLPTLPEQTSRAGTYSERFSFEKIDRLNLADARQALEEPADFYHVEWAASVRDALLERAEGYPHFIQLYASETWAAAGIPSDRPGYRITMTSFNQALPEVQRQLDAGLYRARYERASQGERDYLRAMASLGDVEVSSGEVARVLKKKLTQLSTVRDRLMAKGIIHSPGAGLLDFSAPGFGEYVRRRSLIER